MNRRAGRSVVFLACIAVAVGPSTLRAAEPLPSWNDGEARQSILRFVESVTREGAPTFVAPAERIAVFDNDGTLWAEQPLYFQFVYALDQVKALAPKRPEWKTQPPFSDLLAGNTKAVLASGEAGLAKILAVSHAGMTGHVAGAVLVGAEEGAALLHPLLHARLRRVQAVRWSRGVPRRPPERREPAVVVRPVPVEDPLPDVPCHAVQP